MRGGPGVWGSLGMFGLKHHPHLTGGRGPPATAGPQVFRDFSPWEATVAHLLGALLESLRDELPLHSAPIGQHVHNGGAVHP